MMSSIEWRPALPTARPWKIGGNVRCAGLLGFGAIAAPCG